jgi:molybdopterin/thiamine biosynthesis adenylyltransferase
MTLSDAEKERYLRHLSIQDWDQEKLKSAKVLIVGLGGLGTVSALYLTLAGVGKIHLCDGGCVERSNLNRQILYSEDSIGRFKVDEAKRRLFSMNPDVHIETNRDVLDRGNIKELAKDCDLIIDGLDNIESRFILNEYSVREEIPYVYGAVQGWEGFVSIFHPPHTACLACILPRYVQSKNQINVPGFIPGLIGLLQVSETIKFILGMEGSLLGRLLIYDSPKLTFDIVEVEKNMSCPQCSVLRGKIGE